MRLWPFSRRDVPTSNAHATRGFDAAIVNRLMADWLGTSASIDHELRGQLARLRQRSRDLANNNDYVRRFLSMVVRNVVGPAGFNLQARVEDAPGRPDAVANKAIEQAFDRWSRSCDVTGRHSFAGLCRLLLRTVARDGEALVVKVRGSAARNPFGYALSVLDVSRLDVTYNVSNLPGGRSIMMGVERDNYGRPLAYHVMDSAPGDLDVPRRRMRLPASDVWHLFTADQPEQTRGLPWLHTAMVRLHHLKGYDEAAIIASRLGASKAGMYTAPEGDPSNMTQGEFVENIEPGQTTVAPAGYTYQDINPSYPHQQYDMFVKACLRGIASGLDISYHSLANDLEGVNYSSIRSGVLEDREAWTTLQGWFIDSFLAPLYDEWLATALAAGAITTPGGTALPLAKLAKFSAHVWQGRRWAWVDPLKDMKGAILAVDHHLASPQMIAAQTGRDLDTVLDDLAAYRRMLAERDLDTPVGDADKPAPPPPPAGESDD